MARRRSGGCAALGRASPACLVLLAVMAGEPEGLRGQGRLYRPPCSWAHLTRPSHLLLAPAAGWAVQPTSAQGLQLQPMAGVARPPPAAAPAAAPPASAPAVPQAGCTCTDQLAPGYPTCQALVSRAGRHW